MRSTMERGEDLRSRAFRPVRAVVMVLAGVLLATAGFVPTAGAAEEVDDGPTAARWAAMWLDDQLDAGLPVENFGSPDWGTTLEIGLALAAVEGHEARLDGLWAAVEAERETIVSASGADVPGRLALVILLAEAIGEDPAAVGSGPGEDLVARLEATRTVGGPDEGLFGNQTPTYDGAYRQGYSIAALVAAGATPDPTTIDWLVDQQCADGSWMPYRADTTVPCAYDAAAYVGPDSNSTAAAIHAFVAAGQGAGSEVASALSWLDSAQASDGGWGVFAGDGSDPNSTAVVMMALTAADELDAPAFADQAAAPMDALLSFQLGCSEASDAGSFTYPGSNGAPNLFATAQATSAAAGASLGISAPIISGPAPEPCAQDPVVDPTVPTSAPAGSPGLGGPGTPGAGTAQPMELAFTGASNGYAAVLGVSMLVLGAFLLLSARRTRRA